MGVSAATWHSSVTRVSELVTFILMSVWIAKLGGLSLSPKQLSATTNDTGQLFNWHPLLMALAFPVVMAEAVLSYRSPLMGSSLKRPQRKALHAALQLVALILIIGALAAALNSHELKLPSPIPNLYSPHSWLGLLVVILVALQFLAGAVVFLLPNVALHWRQQLSPVHQFLGRAVFIGGLANMAVGIQEKTTFVQTSMQLSGAGLRDSVIAIPAALQIFLALTGLLVLSHHAVPEKGKSEEGPALLESSSA